MNDPSGHIKRSLTAEQVHALRRIQTALWIIHQTNEKINRAITEHALEDVGVIRLHSTPQALTLGSIAETMRKHEGAMLLVQEEKAA